MARFSLMLHRSWLLLVCSLFSSFGGSSAADDNDVQSLTFERSIRPILKAHCWHCHGEGETLSGSLDARLAGLLLKGGESGPAVIAGDHKSSPIYLLTASGEMPPGKKKLTPAELALISQWIDAGAKTLRPEPAEYPASDPFTAEDREHWAFQPVIRPATPSVTETTTYTNPIDLFLGSKLESAGLDFGAQADKETLIRRLYFDLTGLPPSPEAVDEFVSGSTPDAWPQLVDRLLNSPEYGERWARHWLDIVGYADSDGYTESDSLRPWAWKYRDYVIQSFNSDKPWDRFLTEQIAGDEMIVPPYQDLTSEQAELLTATGFLRMGPDGTADSAVDQNVARNDVLADTIKIVSTSLLGMSVGCAQCHEHRYDPITQEDYYRLRAIFEPAYDWQNWRAPGNRLVSLWSADVRQQAAAVDKELEELNGERTKALDVIVSETFERELQKLPVDLQPLARTARETPTEKRTEEQNRLIREYPFLNVDRGSVYLYVPDRLTTFNTTWDKRTEETKKKRPVDDLVMCLTEIPGQIPVTKLFSRGDYRSPRQEVGPGELSVLASSGHQIPHDDPAVPTTGRRLAYARHLTGGRHPLVARVLVNRFWMHHFGQGLVSTPSDFGIRGEHPSHPELLDWLAADFMEEGWQLKRLHRLILNSTAWKQSSARRPELESVDPDNRLLGRMSIRRMETETLRDALLMVSEKLVRKQFGPPVPVSPDEVGQIVLAVDTRDSAGRPSGTVVPLGEEEFRRSIYIQVRRSMPLGVMEPFDSPVVTPNCERRTYSTTAPQSLLMLNNPFILQSAERLSEIVKLKAGNDQSDQVRFLWKRLFSRNPSDEDVSNAKVFLNSTETSESGQVDANALTHLCHALLSSNGFLYID